MQNVFLKNKLRMGRIISHSKSSYIQENPGNKVYFNANIFALGHGKIWYGDLDITKEEFNLKEVARELAFDLFILKEMDGRFEYEDVPDSQIIKLAVHHVKI